MTSSDHRKHGLRATSLQRGSRLGVSLTVLFSLAPILCPRPASAQSSGRAHPQGQTPDSAAVSNETGQAGSVESCVPAHERALDGLDAHDWLAARTDLEQCARPSCPTVVREECATELGRLLPRIPRVVFAARDHKGQDLVDVRVYANGALLLPKLGGEGVSMNPGPYRFELVGPGDARTQQDVLLREGEVNRRVDVVFSPPATPAPVQPPPVTQTLFTPPVTVSAVVTATGLGFFGFFAIKGKAVESCQPDCTQIEVDRLRRDYLVADISLGVAVAAAATGAYFIFTQPSASSSITARASHRPGGGFLSAAMGF